MKKYIRNLWLVVGMSLLLATSLLPLLSQTTLAAPVDTAKIDDKAKSYIYLQALSACMNNNTLSSSTNGNPTNDWIEPADAINGSFFASRPSVALPIAQPIAIDISLGYISTSKQGCNESGWVQDALKLWGWTDNIEALQAFGFTANDEGDYVAPSNRVQNLINAVISKYYGNQNNYTKDQDAIKYHIYSQAFKQICGATSVGPKAGASASNLALLNTDNGYLLNELNASYQIEEIIFKANLGKGEKIDVYQGEYISCIDTVSRANQYSSAYAQYMERNKNSENPPTTTPPGSSGTDGELNDESGGCDNALSPFGWVVCPIIDLVDNMYDFFVDLVRQALFFEPEKYNNTQLQEVSRIFVGFANIALVIFALLMIASQIFGFEVFSAYTVKKVLPKILIGAILIQLSWPIFTLMIQFVNALGTGLYWLMMAPFDVGGSGYVEIGSILGSGSDNQGDAVNNAAGLTLGLGALAAGVGAAALTGTWLTIILAALGVLVSLIVAILTLVVREVVLILLLAIAPVALALWIFPGTQKYWNIWWQSFIKLLLMYPLIMGLLAAGSIAAIILSQSSNPSDGIDLNKVFAIIAYFAPLFLIGATYKFAGQAFGSIATMSNKFGSKVNGSGFGLRNQAKMRKENSALSNTLANRRENLQQKLQDKSARRITGKDEYSSGVRGLSSRLVRRGSSGIINPNSETSLQNLDRAQTRAAKQITSREKEHFENLSALAEYQVTSDAKRIMAENQYIRDNFDLFAVEQQVRAARLAGQSDFTAVDVKAKDGSKKTLDLKGISQDQRLNTDIALQALANKDDTASLNTWLANSENFAALKDRGTDDKQSWNLLADKLATAAKGASSYDLSVTGVGGSGEITYTSGLTDTVKNFASNAGTQQTQTVQALKQGLNSARPDDRANAAGLLQDIVRGPKIDQQHIDIIAKELARDATGSVDTTLQALYVDQLAAARGSTATVQSTAPGDFAAR